MVKHGFGSHRRISFMAVIITSLPTAGTLLFNGIAVTQNQVIAVSDIQYLTYVPPSGQTGLALDSFTFKVQDDGGAENGGIDTDPIGNTITIDVTDPPQ